MHVSYHTYNSWYLIKYVKDDNLIKYWTSCIPVCLKWLQVFVTSPQPQPTRVHFPCEVKLASNKPIVDQSLIHWRALHRNTTLIVITNEPKGFPPPHRGEINSFMCVITFSACHPAACQGTVTPTACWESWWARVRGRWRRRRRESSASGREGRSWRNAPAPRRCYRPSLSRWLRSNQRLSTRCGTSTLCCEYSSLTSIRVLDMVMCVTCRIHSYICFTLTPKLLVMRPVQRIVISVEGLRCLLSVFTHGDDNAINDYPVFLVVLFTVK